MKRLATSKSGREIYGPKWQNNDTDNSNTSEAEDEVSDDAVPPPKTETAVVGNQHQTQTSEGTGRRGPRVSDRHQSMYKAALEGDFVAAEMLLEEDPNLACDEISEEGDRALHVAVAMNHQQLVRTLVGRMSSNDLVLLDGHGYTACCYAAILGAVDLADIMIIKNPTLATLRDRENKTPLLKAAQRGKAEMVSYFLKSAEGLSTDEWFDILLASIRCQMYGVALTLARRIEQLATMANDEGTALHVLAKQVFYTYRFEWAIGVMRRDMRLLAKNLWDGMQRLGQANVLELLKNSHLLHDAAEVGNLELITMVTHTYPHLKWLTNNHGHTIFHIAVKHRHKKLFQLINEIGARTDLIAISQDRKGNNILHLAALLEPTEKRTLRLSAYQLHWEMSWFENVKAIVPPFCLEMKNNEGYTPRELFSKMQKSLVDETKTWIRNTADSCLLISTLIFTVAFGSTFAVPGGYNQETGIPVLYKAHWFTCFVIFEALTMFSSAFSMINFWRIMASSFEEDLFLKNLPLQFTWALNWLFISVGGAISAFMSAYFLIYVERKTVLVTCVIITIYVLLVYYMLHVSSLFDYIQPISPKKKLLTFLSGMLSWLPRLISQV